MDLLIKKLPNEIWLQIIDYIIPNKFLKYFKLNNIKYELPISYLLLFNFKWKSSKELVLEYNKILIEQVGYNFSANLFN
jgi:hypothetical protein